MDTKLVIAKLYSAISELSDHRRDAFTVRPSNVGQCPLRLQWDKEQAAAGGTADPREGWQDWTALQGTISEELMGELLEAAGAQILTPPTDLTQWSDNVPPDPATGFKPHLDRLIRWPEVGLDEWAVLELKNLRTMAHIELFLEGLYYEHVYWYQGVSYLHLAGLAIKNYGQSDPFGTWGVLAQQGYRPTSLVFFSTAKDPSTTRMLLNQRLKPTQKELNNPHKMTPEDEAKAKWKAGIRDRLEQEFGGRIDFYMEQHSLNDPAVQETWLDIQNVVRRVNAPAFAPPLHDITLREDERDVECRFYCPWVQRHQDLVLNEQLTESLQQAQDFVPGTNIKWDR